MVGMIEALLIGVVVASGLFYLGYFQHFDRLWRKRVLKAIDKNIAQEHRELFKEKLKPIREWSWVDLTPLVATVTTLYAMLEMMEKGEDALAPFLVIAVGGFMLHLVFLLFSLGFLVQHESEIKKNPLFLMPYLSNYMTDKEGVILFWLAGRENEYDSNLLEAEVVNPEKLVSYLLNRDAIRKHADMRDKLIGALEGKEEFLSPKQLQKQKQMMENLKTKMAHCRGFAQDIEDAVSMDKYHESQKEQVDKEAIQRQFEAVQEELAWELDNLDKEMPEVKREEPLDSAERTVVHELKRVAESAMVSSELKQEANELISFIEKRQAEEKVSREKDVQETEALSVIEASKLFYGIPKREARLVGGK